MKKVFLTLAMLLFAFTGTMKAVEVEVGSATATNSYLPTYTFYNYSLTQQIYTAAEIGMAGPINAVSFQMASGPSRTRTLKVFMKHVTRAAFVDGTDWELFEDTDALFSGSVTFNVGWVTIDLDTPFDYNGTDNLLICVQDLTGSWESGPYFSVFTSTNGALRVYGDDAPYPVNNPGVTATVLAAKNYIKLNFLVTGPTNIVADPATIDLGARPSGYWMAPYTFTLTNDGASTTATALETNNTFFAVDAIVPFALDYEETVELEVTTTEATAGTQSGQIMVAYSDGSKGFTTIDITAEAYDAVEPDVFELAEEVTAFPFNETTNTANLYANYAIPGLDFTAHKDAVYKVTFDEDVLFSAGTRGANGKTYMYREDFEGEDGPGHDNYYFYNGPEVLPGPLNMWFSYAYTGTNTWVGTSTGGGIIFGYEIPAAKLQELGVGNCSLLTVEAAARDNSGVAYPYDLYVLRGGTSPADANVIYYQEMEGTPTPDYFFDMNLDEPFVIGDEENLWVMFYSESPYAAYSGRTPVDADAAKIWYTLDGATWYNNSQYTPLIYCYFVELPSGRQVAMNLADMSIKEVHGQGQIAESNAELKGFSHAQRTNELKAQYGRGRAADNLTIFDGAATSDRLPAYVFYFDDYTKTQHVIPATEISAMNGCNINSITYYHTFTTGYTTDVDVDVYLTEVSSTTISSFIDKSTATVVYTGALDFATDGTCTINFTTPYLYNGGNLLVGIENLLDGTYKRVYFNGESGHTGAAIYGSNSSSPASITATAADFLPKTTFSYEVASTPTSTDPTYQIADMFVPAGTYYVVTASTDADFVVDMKTDAVPDPEIPMIIDPIDLTTGIDNPYLLRWILGNYTKEIKVLLGTQFPPEDVFIDWTDELVESAFMMELQHNKTYFAQVIARNDNGNEVASEIVGFTTVIDPVEGFTVANANLYPGDAAEFSWEPSVRSLKGYNLYQDGVKINDELITETEYVVEGLAHNVTPGYDFYVTAYYDEGESDPSDVINVRVAGNGTVTGTVYEQDGTTVIPGATVILRGMDEYNAQNEFTTTTETDGTYSIDVYVGNYTAYATKNGYQECAYDGNVEVLFETTTPDIDIIVYEYYFPLGMIRATEQVEENNVLVEWDWNPEELIVDFETGDFSQADFTLPASYPWEVTTLSPHEGTYAMKSTCEGIANGNSSIECTVDVPYDGLMGFYVKVSTESGYDKFHFYIDGNQMAEISGAAAYAYKEYTVSEGTHTYKWEYTKDGSVNSNDDCVYVDDIYLYKQAEPIPGGGVMYDFEGSTLMGWTTIDADGDGYNWSVGSDVMSTGYGHNSSTDMVLSQSYDNNYGVLYPDNYLVSPAKLSVQDGAFISFYACAQDASYAAEHFGVAVSTASNTNPSDFTTIQEWTMSAKGAKVAEEHATIRGTKAQGSWYQYTVDLSAYAGQEIWVALRHFNCYDWFYLDVDDIMLADGSAKFVPNNNRSFQSYKLYRRNINLPEPWTAELIAEPAADDVDYIDNDWANLPYGVYQWGIQAYYDGNAPTDRSVLFSDDFEGGDLSNWTLIDADGDYENWVIATPADYGIGDAHSGDYCASSWSWNNYSIDPDNYMVSPLVEGATSIQYYVATNDAYPDHYAVMASSTGTDAGDFTIVYEETAGSKSAGLKGVRSSTTKPGTRAMSAWNEKNIDLPAGTKYVAFRHFNSYDMNYLFIDDVTINGAATPPTPPTPSSGDGLSEILWSNTIEKDMYSAVTVNVTLNNGQSAAGATVAMVGPEEEYNAVMDETGSYVFEAVRKGDYTITASMEGFGDEVFNYLIEEDETVIDIMLMEAITPVTNLYVSPTGWAMWDGQMPGGSGVTPGPGPGTGGDEFDESFESGSVPAGWITIDADGDGYGWRMMSEASLPAHTGSDGMFSQSYDNNFGALNPNNFLVTNQVTIGANSVFSFYACAQDASWAAEHFGVGVSTASQNNPSDFTMVQEWTLSSKEGAKGPRGTNAQGTWYQYSVNLGAYAGQQVYICIRHFNCTDMFYIDIDDVVLTNTAKGGDRAALSYKVMLDGVYEGETQWACFQHNVDGLEEGSTHVTSVMPIYATGVGTWETYTWEYTPCDNYAGATNVSAAQDGVNVNINFTLPDGTPTPPTPPTPGAGEWYYYDDGTYATSIGASQPIYWAVMFPAGTYTGNMVTKAAVYDNGNSAGMVGSVTIYNDGTAAPATAVGTKAVTLSGAEDFVEIEFDSPITIDPSKNLWVVMYSSTDLAYPANASNDVSGDPNGRWVSLDGSTWMDVASAGVPGYTWMLRAYVATSTKTDVVEILDPMQPISNPATTVSMAPMGIRAQWDVLKTFDAAEGGQYGVATDGVNIYTCNWGYSSATYNFYKYDMDGNMIEGFNISGCGTIRDLTYDGQYFYGGANSNVLYCVDLANKTLIGSTSTGVSQIRHCSYDPVNDGFWVGAWSDLKLIDRSGAVQFTATAPSSCGGTGYYTDDDNVPHLLLNCQPSSDAQIYDYNINTNTISSSPVYNASGNVPGATGSAGGAFVGSYDGKTCMFINFQQSPNLVAICELSEGEPTPPTPPVPTGNVLGAMIFRDGELITGTPVTTSPFVDPDAPAGEHEYCVRVVYEDWSMACAECAEVEYECIPVTNLVGEAVYYNDTTYGAYLTWECEQAEHVVEYHVFLTDTLAAIVNETEVFINIAQHVGNYTFGVTAVYPNCESEMVTVEVNVTDVNEAEVPARIYPNPTRNTVTIEAQAMNRITVVNALGQVVYDAAVNADMTQLNLGQYNAGVYMVRINTESGVSVKRVTVVK